MNTFGGGYGFPFNVDQFWSRKRGSSQETVAESFISIFTRSEFVAAPCQLSVFRSTHIVHWGNFEKSDGLES